MPPFPAFEATGALTTTRVTQRRPRRRGAEAPGPARQRGELPELVHALPVALALVLDGPVRAAPGADAREAAVRAVRRRPLVEHHGLGRPDPVEAAGGDRAVVAADVLADRDE